MSKIIDTLNNPFKKERVRSSAQEEIAKIYLKVSDKNKARKEIRAPKFPWAIAAIALAIAFFAILFKSTIDIKVRILGEVPSFDSGQPDKFGSLRDKGLYLLKGAEPNKYLIKSAGFAGDAKAFSKIEDDELVLCNSRGSGWANYGIYLKEPVDLSRLDIKYTARGESGGEYLTVALLDSENRSYRVEKDMSSSLGVDWQDVTINFKYLRSAIDLTNITAVRFEFGSLTAGNSSTSTIFLKDIRLVRAKRMGV